MAAHHPGPPGLPGESTGVPGVEGRPLPGTHLRPSPPPAPPSVQLTCRVQAPGGPVSFTLGFHWARPPLIPRRPGGPSWRLGL